ncbi:MAG: hypothetical protein ABIO29_07355 [Sphingomicrobium sp.]
MRPELYLLAAILGTVPAPALATAQDFQLVNGTEVALGTLTIRRAGTDSWRPLTASAAPGAKAAVPFKDEDCAFDIQAVVAGSGPVTWAGVNLCEVKSVTLKRDGSTGAWVDYDGE